MTNAARFAAAHAETRRIVAAHGVSYRIQFAICLKAAYAVAPTAIITTEPQTIEALAAEINSRKDVASANIWKGRRIYVNLYARNTSFRGDRSYQLYYCADRGWISESGKGTTSSDYIAALNKFEEEVGIEG